MNYLDLTLPTPAENLACDEALLDFHEENGGDGVLRFWEPHVYFVVVGYANRVAGEVNRAACDAAGIQIFRRCSGGGTVLQGPGCLNYSLVLKIGETGPLHSISSANRFIMERNRVAIQSTVHSPSAFAKAAADRQSTVEIRGHTDLAFRPPTSNLRPLKFSGNAQRRRKNFLLFHGTFLLQFDLARIETFLLMPSKQPEYRANRSHEDFLTNLNLPADAVKSALREAWGAEERMKIVPVETIALLARDKYAGDNWNLKF